ncbi:MAG: pantoate--beta-alanine ligase [Acidimicrobiales bacterium]
MQLVHTISELRRCHDQARANGARVGLVPTMGFLHAGHRSLMEAARAQNDLVTVTIFVNPLQFGPTEDLDAYPRDLDGDLALATEAGVDVVFAPTVAEMYPGGAVATSVRVSGLADQLEGASRPGHFDGVATVVAKLFSIAGACRAYFGEKDYQQLQIVTRMAADLSIPVEVVACPTVREPNGLARSSRNAYLDDGQRQAAAVLKRALDAAAHAISSGGERDPLTVETLMAAIVGQEPQAELDYARVVHAATLEAVNPLAGQLRLLIAARVGPARLIDNVGASAPT